MPTALPQRNTALASVIALAAVTSAAAAFAADTQAPAKAAVITTEIRLDIDATGRVTSATLNDRLPAALKDRVAEHAMTWRFEAPMLNGTPVAGTTYARTAVCAMENDQGGVTMKVGEISNGPGWDSKRFRHFFPPITNELLQLKKLEIDIVYDVGADGRATLVSMSTVPEKVNSRRTIESALKKWLATTPFQPEELGGKPVVTRMRMPISFTWEQGLADAKQMQRQFVESHPTCQALLRGASEAKPAVALDSPFRVKPSS